MTTPAGVYFVSTPTLKANIDEYGEALFILNGISVLGHKEFLGQHKTYEKHGELAHRTAKLASPTPNDNDFSNGCINIDAGSFETQIKPYFLADCGEVLFVLPDAKSRASGVVFNPEALLQQILPFMIKIAQGEEQSILEQYQGVTDDAELEERDKQLERVRTKIEGAEKYLKNRV